VQGDAEDRASRERVHGDALPGHLGRAAHLDGPDDRLAVLARDDAVARLVHHREEDPQVIHGRVHAIDDTGEDLGGAHVVHRERMVCLDRHRQGDRRRDRDAEQAGNVCMTVHGCSLPWPSRS
jgi:hypothetical protein